VLKKKRKEAVIWLLVGFYLFDLRPSKGVGTILGIVGVDNQNGLVPKSVLIRRNAPTSFFFAKILGVFNHSYLVSLLCLLSCLVQ
jgi:hypothetical protein